MSNLHPTPYQDVNKILILLLTEAKTVLGRQFIGMYLYGSFASGDFDLKSSDIDFLVVTESVLPKKLVSELETMHNRIWKTGSKWAAKLEGSYVHRELIRRHDPDGAPCPTVNEENFYLDRRGSDWIIQRHVIRENGVVLEGPDPKTLIDFVSPDDIRSAVLSTLREWWFPMLDDKPWLLKRGSEYHAYAIVSMCRALHALEHGTIVSKPQAVQWAKKTLAPKWRPLIDQAVVSAHGQQPDILNEALQFIRYTLEKTS
ncbi:MAG TPA: aminoglycoside adenylyltransferase domain-containing protein [Anaerolineales bacterium]|nr:aminoglycoside adenylyltransferase domain-containing protein [Anaerolineales bacterium]